MARLSYGVPHLAKLKVRETKKLYIVEEETGILGYSFWNKQVRKDDPNVFLTVDEAISYLLVRNSVYCEQMKAGVQKTYETHDLLTELRDQLRD
jgi:hypothetical protein